jgi:hypothetical protein
VAAGGARDGRQPPRSGPVLYRVVGIPVVEGRAAFHRGDCDQVSSCCGSHAQRDVVDWTLTEAAVSAGQGDVALSLARERLATRPRRAPTRRFLRHAESILAYRAWCAGSCDLSIAGCIGSSGRGRGCNWV